MPAPCSLTFPFRVRYADTDQMGTYYNARALEWFEMARAEIFRAEGLSIPALEAEDCYLPVVEAFVRYRGPAVYDDALSMEIEVWRVGNVRLRCCNRVRHVSDGRNVCEGYTLHAAVTRAMKPRRLPPLFDTLAPFPKRS